MTTHRERHRLRHRIRATRWPAPAETGEVYLCYPPDCCPPADPGDALVLSCSGTLAEARSDARVFGGAAIYVCRYYVRPGGDVADGERFVEVCMP